MNSSKTYRKIVVITSRFPYPLEKGDKLRAFYQIKELSKSFEVHLICTHENLITDEQLKHLQAFCKSIHVYPINFFQKVFGLIRVLINKKPFQVGYFYHYSIQKKINRFLKELQPSHIFCQLIRVSEYVKNYHQCPKTIDYMDALSKGMERRSKDSNIINKILLKSEHKRLLKYENSIFEYFEYHTIISSQDRDYIFHKNRNKIKVVPNGIETSFLTSTLENKEEVDLIFIGNMAYPPNITAVRFIVNDILPLLPKGIKVKITGSSPPNEILKLSSPEVEITGYVENIQSAYKSAEIFIAPMFLGTGLQNKLLEAMALKIPCITTSLSNNALGAEPEKEILIANNAREFASQIIRLKNDRKLKKQLTDDAYKFISANFRWEKVTKKLVDIIKEDK